MFDLTDVNVKTNNSQSLNINAVSGTIIKTYAESFIIKFNAKSEIAADILDKHPRMVKYTERHESAYIPNHTYEEPVYEPVVVLQIMLCGNDTFLAEIMWKDDFDELMKPQIIENKEDTNAK